MASAHRQIPGTREPKQRSTSLPVRGAIPVFNFLRPSGLGEEIDNSLPEELRNWSVNQPGLQLKRDTPENEWDIPYVGFQGKVANHPERPDLGLIGELGDSAEEEDEDNDKKSEVSPYVSKSFTSAGDVTQSREYDNSNELDSILNNTAESSLTGALSSLELGLRKRPFLVNKLGNINEVDNTGGDGLRTGRDKSASTLPPRIGYGSVLCEPQLLEYRLNGPESKHWFKFMTGDDVKDSRAFMSTLRETEKSIGCAFWNPLAERRPPAVGDVGYLDASGRFITIFNFLCSAEQNKQQKLYPPESHQEMKSIITGDPIDIAPRYRQDGTVVFYPGSGSKAIKYRRDDAKKAHFFDIPATDETVAVMVLPCGAATYDMERSHIGLNPDYFRQNVVSWYKHASMYYPKRLDNGCLFCIMGTVEAPVWGKLTTNTFDPPKSKPKKESICYQAQRDNANHFTWDVPYSHFIYSSGPTSIELAAPNRRVSNYIVAVNPASIWVDNAVWAATFPERAQPSDQRSHGHSPSATPVGDEGITIKGSKKASKDSSKLTSLLSSFGMSSKAATSAEQKPAVALFDFMETEK